MRTNFNQIGKSNVLVLLLLSTGLMNHVMLIRVLLTHSGRDAWIAVLIGFALSLVFWTPVLALLASRTEQAHLPTWLQTHFGTTIRLLITLPLFLVLLVSSTITLQQTINWLITSNYEITPRLILILPFLLLCFWASWNGVRKLSYLAGLLGFWVILFGFFVMSANTPNKDINFLAPILEHGFSPVWRGVLDSAGAFSEVFLILLFQQEFRFQVRKREIVVLLGIFLMLTLGPLTASIMEFGLEEAIRQRYPAYEEWRLIKLGKYIEHIDFLATYQWLSGSFIRVAFLHTIAVNLFASKKKFLLCFTYALLLVLTMIPYQDYYFFKLVIAFFFPLVCVVFATVSIILVVLSQILKARRSKQQYEPDQRRAN